MGKFGVIGSRGLNNKKQVYEYLHKVVTKYHNAQFVSGGCKDSADEWCYDFCIEFGYDITVCGAGFKVYGNAGYFKRNKRVVDKSDDVIISFWDGKSRGTKWTMDYAESIGKQVITP